MAAGGGGGGGGRREGGVGMSCLSFISAQFLIFLPFFSYF